MQNQRKSDIKNQLKHSWHTPELRKISITQKTQFEVGSPVDGYTGTYNGSTPVE